MSGAGLSWFNIGHNPPNVPEMMHESEVARERFATLIGAAQEEIGLLYATGDGENIVTRALNMQAGDNVVIDDLHYHNTYVLYQRPEGKTRGSRYVLCRI